MKLCFAASSRLDRVRPDPAAVFVKECHFVSSSGTSRIDEFEALRGAMALWVVAGHVAHTVTQGPEPSAWIRLLLQNAYAVDVFIALSGFVICALLESKREPYGVYLSRRALRIFPAYLVFLMLSIVVAPMALDVLMADPSGNPRTAVRIGILQAGMVDFWPHLLAHLPLLQGLVPEALLPNAAFTLLGQAWSVSVEWQFYLIAPLLIRAFDRHALLASIGCAAAAAASQLWLRDVANPAFIGFHLHFFLAGILSYRVWRRSPQQSARAIQGVVLGCVIIALAAFRIRLSFSLWMLAFAGTLLLHRLDGGRLARLGRGVVGNPAVQWLGRISYSVYLSHLVVMVVAARVMQGLRPDQPLGFAALLAVTLGGTLVVSQLTYRWIERPCIAFGKSLGRRPAGVAEALATG